MPKNKRGTCLAVNVRGSPEKSNNATSVLNKHLLEIDYLAPIQAGIDVADRSAFRAFKVRRNIVPVPIRQVGQLSDGYGGRPVRPASQGNRR
jgi:hypothetical protein